MEQDTPGMNFSIIALGEYFIKEKVRFVKRFFQYLDLKCNYFIYMNTNYEKEFNYLNSHLLTKNCPLVNFEGVVHRHISPGELSSEASDIPKMCEEKLKGRKNAAGSDSYESSIDNITDMEGP